MKKWKLKTKETNEYYDKIHKEIQIVLRNRGILTELEMQEFLSENPVLTYDPFLLKGMNIAVEKICGYLKAGRKICIYGDYDVDGITSVCLLFEFFSNVSKNLMWYIPSRTDEGYGLNKEAIETIKASGTELIVTVDCGSTSYEEVEHAKKLGMEIIVTDHHNMNEKPADCILINPKQEDCKYPFKELCGCGIAFKLAQAIQQNMNLPKRTIAKELDLVAIATIADVMPIIDENRTLVKYGLKAINTKKRPGLEGLINAVGINGKAIKSYDVAFILAPHINAGGRVDRAEYALKLLMARLPEKIVEYSEKLVENNNKRKDLQTEGYKQCLSLISDGAEKSVLLVSGVDIHEGVAGIVSGKLREKFYCPTLIVTKSKESGILKGTGRSIPGIDLYELLKAQEEFLIGFGGHKAACGFSLAENNLPFFRSGLESILQNLLKEEPDLFTEKLWLDGILEISEMSMDLVKAIAGLEPFGFQNEKPIFAVQNLTVSESSFMGAEQQHVKLFLKDKNGQTIEAIKFNITREFMEIAKKGNQIDLAGTPSVNEWRDRITLQFIINDIRLTEELLQEAE